MDVREEEHLSSNAPQSKSRVSLLNLVTRHLAALYVLISNRWLGNVNTVRSLSTSGLAPKKQIQCWTDALTELCGQFDIDPLEASSLEGQINYTTVSRLKLCQIETSQHRLAHPISRAKSGEHPYVKILFQTYGISHFEQSGRRIENWCPAIVSPLMVSRTVIRSSPNPALEVVIVPRICWKNAVSIRRRCRHANFRRAPAPAGSRMTLCMPHLAKLRNCHHTTQSAWPIR